MRVRVTIDEPYDLIAHSEEPVAVTGDVVGEESDRHTLIVDVSPSVVIAGIAIRRVEAGPRHTGDTFDPLARGESVIIHGTMYSLDPDARPVNFIGLVNPVDVGI